MTQKIIFLKGLPASGKTTWSMEYMVANPNSVRVNKDDIRQKLHNGVYSKQNEAEVIEYQAKIANEILCGGFDLIVDNTHLFGTHEKYFRDLAKVFKCEFEVKEFNTPIQECIERDKLRKGNAKVGEGVIITMAEKAGLIKNTGGTEFAVVPMDNSKPKAIIVDIDGTIAQMQGRSPYDYSRVGEDKVHWDVVKLIEYYINGWYNEKGETVQVILCSGRPDSCRKDTEAWLEANKIEYDELHMRQSDDRRKDCQVKFEILLDLSKKFNIILCVDDRSQVVSMWRQSGIRCLQVAEGNF